MVARILCRTFLVAAMMSACSGKEPLVRDLIVVPQVQPPGTIYSALAFSSDGSVLVAGRRDAGVIDLWQIETGLLLRSISAHQGTVDDIRVGPGGAVTTAATDGTICHFRLDDTALPRCVGGTFAGVTAAAVSGDAKWVVQGGKHDKQLFKRNGVIVRNADTGRARRRVRRHFGGSVGPVAVSAQGNLMVSVGEGEGVAAGKLAKKRKPKRIQLRRLPGGRLVHHLPLPTPQTRVLKVEFSPDGQHLVGASAGKVWVWSVASGQITNVVQGQSAFAFSPKGDRVFVAVEGGAIGLPFPSLDPAGAARLPAGGVNLIALGPEGSTAAISSAGALQRWDVKTRTPQRTLAVSTSFDGATFSDDGKKAYLASGGAHWELDLGLLSLHRIPAPPLSTLPRATYDLAFGKHKSNFVTWERHLLTVRDPQSKTEIGTIGSPVGIKAVAFSRDGTRMMTGQSGFESSLWWWDFKFQAQLWDMTNGELLRSFEAQDEGVGAIAISEDKKKAALGGANFRRAEQVRFSPGGVIRYLDLVSGKLERELIGHAAAIQSLAFSPDGAFLLSTSRDGSARLWKLADGTSVVIVAAGEEWLVFSDDGYFDASRYGHTLVSAVKGLQAYGIDQLAPRNNRPDLLLTRLGLGTPEIVAHFKARYERRLRKLGLDESKLSSSLEQAPIAKVSAVEVDAAKAQVRFELSDNSYDLIRYNLWVNGVPAFGPLGKKISGRKHSLAETVVLSPGRNRIEVSAVNAAGVESLRDFRVAERQSDAPRNLYYIGFGVSRYANEKLNLRFAHQDALDLEKVLLSMEGRGFAEVHTRAIVDEQVTVETIKRAKAYLADADVNDTVVLFVAGHGTHSNDAAADYYYVTHETDVRRLTQTAAPFELIEDLLAETKARNKLFLLDTCESGEREDDDPASAGVPTATARGLVPRTTRALEFNAAGVSAQATVKPRRHLLERERYIYNDLARRTGAIVFASSRGAEFSYERDELQNGVFTEVLVEALTGTAADTSGDGKIDTQELRKFVSAKVAEMTQQLQNPTVDRDNREIRIELPLGSTVSPVAPSEPTEATVEP